MQELFRQNAYGDTWQEPELFDQPVNAVPVCDAVRVIVATQGNGYLRCALPTGHSGPHRTGWETPFEVEAPFETVAEVRIVRTGSTSRMAVERWGR